MMGGSGYGPDMMGYGSADRGDGPRAGYRGNHMCWHETNSGRGYGYNAPCGN